jgi:hypothetical protein
MIRTFAGLAFATLAALLCLAGPCRAEDAQDVRGTKSGCLDVTADGNWTSYTSASLEDESGTAALAASLYWTEVAVYNGSASVYVCQTAAASCHAAGDTTNKRVVLTGAAWVLPVRGKGVQTVAIKAANGTTYQLCGYFRTTP